MRKPPDPELVRRVVERVRRGDSKRAIARDAGVSDCTVRRWAKAAGAIRDEPLIMRMPPPPPAAPPIGEEAAKLPKALGDLADRLKGDDAALVRRAIAALAAAPSIAPESPDPAVDMRGWLVHQIRVCEDTIKQSKLSHNFTAAKQATASLEKLAYSLRQLDKSASGDDIIIPRAELDKRVSKLKSTLKLLTTSTPRCVDCERAIRVSWADEVSD
jgi:hypothetical protein